MTAHKAGPVVDMSRSPHAILHPVPLSAVQLQDDFWEPRRKINRERTIPSQLQHCEETGRIDNFRIASGKKQGTFQGRFFNDSDVYKWAEAAAFSLATDPDPKLDADLDAVIAEIAAAQQPDGYLNTYFMFERESERFTNLKDMHEIYCAGHLFQAAVAHYRATGKKTLLDVACRYADLLYTKFGPEGEPGTCGHEEAEMALVELYRVTGESRYLELAQSMVEARGKKPGLFDNSAYHQDHLPFVEQREMIGHAVRHTYLCCGAADVYAEKGNSAYRAALTALWENFTERKMYITGGAGARYEGEAFGADFELPNTRAYAETCAAIGSVMWNWRMLNLTGEPGFADLMETTLYNAVLPGLSLDGTRYFYENPLSDRGGHVRQEWFGCACCPPNVARLLASLPGYFYSTSEQGLYVHLYATSTATIEMQNGETVVVQQKTNYPWDGDIEIKIEKAPSEPFSLFLRIPGWYETQYLSMEETALEINGEEVTWEQDIEKRSASFDQYAGVTYLDLERQWQDGDTVRLTIPMHVQRITCHPYVANNYRRVALKRGPLVYCLEQADNGESDVWDILIHEYMEIFAEHVPDLLGGITVLTGRTIATDAALYGLYQTHYTNRPLEQRPVTLTAIPYYAWANREPGPMQVWIPMV